MTPTALEDLFRELTVPTPGALSARPVAPGSRFRVARQQDGAPALLVLIDASTESPPSGEQLANLTYRPRERLRIEGPDGTTEQAVHTVLTCASPDAELRHYFFRVVAALVDELGASPGARAIDEGVGRLLELFRAMERPARRSVQGVWAELFLIARSGDPAFSVSAWHAEPDAVHDFVAGLERVEVKSTQGAIRRHHFRLEQLSTPPEGTLVVASMMLSSSEEGVTVADLVERISRRLPSQTEHRSRLEAIVAASLGSDWRMMSRVAFDEAGAAASLMLIDANDVPSVARDVPVEVSEVRFLVDLSGVDECEPGSEGALFRALLAPTNHDGGSEGILAS